MMEGACYCFVVSCKSVMGEQYDNKVYPDERVRGQMRMKKRGIIIILAVVMGLCVASVVGVYYIYPQYQLYQQYQAAIQTYNQSDDPNEALEQFQALNGYKNSQEWIENCEYRLAEQYMKENNYDDALAIYEKYQNLERYKLCLYQKAKNYMQGKEYEKAVSIFQDLDDYEDSRKQVNECNYQIAENYYSNKKYRKALKIFKTLGSYRMSAERLQECYNKLRFAKFDYDTFREYVGAEEGVTKAELKEYLIECMEKEFYGIWYEENSDTEMVITKETIQNKPYGLLSYQGKYDDVLEITIKYSNFAH